MALRGIDRRRLTGAQLAVDLEQRLLRIGRAVLFQRGHDALVVAEKVDDRFVGTKPERAHKGRHRQLAVFIDADVENVV